MIEPLELKDLAESIARKAGSELLRRRFDQRQITEKSSAADFVTDADLASQAIIIEELRKFRPDDGLIAEEDLVTKGRTGLTWIIDPLDGTTNYTYNRDEFAVSIAVDDEHGTVAGCVYAPALDRCYTAARGEGSWCNGQQLISTPKANTENVLLGTGFSYDPVKRKAQAQWLADKIDTIGDIRRLGAAALEICAVADNRIDAFIETDLSIWDVKAAALIATEAGASVQTTEGLNFTVAIVASIPGTFPSLEVFIEQMHDDVSTARAQLSD